MESVAVNKELKFTGVQSDMVKATWPSVRGMIKMGLAFDMELYRPIDILDNLLKKKMQLWVAIDPEKNEIVAALVTQLSVYPQCKACWIVLVGGSGMNDWTKFMQVIKLWAKSKGCNQILSFSRDGWIRKLAPYGFKKLRTMIGCRLENENEI